jgi:hypothetical protein
MFRVISIALLLWGLGGAAIYVAYFVEAPEQFARTAETAANRQAYADYIANIPFWAISVAIIAAASRLLGAIGLLLRRAWSLPLYIVSVIFFLATLIRAFVFADVTRVMSAAHLAIEGVFLGLGIFAVWFARESKSRGILN